MTAVTTSDEPSPLWFVAEHESSRRDVSPSTTVSLAVESGYDIVTIPITTPAFHQRVLKTIPDTISPPQSRPPQLTPLDTLDTNLGPEETNSRVIGLVSPWVMLGAGRKDIAEISYQVLRMELAYAAFCGVQNVIIHGPSPGADVMQYARAISEGLATGPYLNIRIMLPMSGSLEQDELIEDHLSELNLNGHDTEQDADNFENDKFSAWRTWNTIRGLCDYSPRLGIALEIPRQLPSRAIQDRWFAEPVRILVYPRTSFLRNAKGYPVLHKTHQEYLTRLQRLRMPPWIMLGDVLDRASGSAANSSTNDPTPAEASNHTTTKFRNAHLQYIRHLQHNQPPRPTIEQFGQGYQDYMQSPLQPLTDNLESITYEVFEKDPVKYDWYEEATKLALLDLSAKLGNSRPLNVAVVGSGRGPLVSKALLASQTSGVNIRMWAVEKNPNAFVHLQRRNRIDPLWNSQVTVVKTDMRAWQGPIVDGELTKLDIMISELLGSFADNELSPECLDGVQHVLHPEHGINIPQSYSAHLTPISTPRLYSDLLSRSADDKWEVPVVVMLQQLDYLSLQDKSRSLPDVKEAWDFHHPLLAEVLKRQKLRAGGSVSHGGPGGAYGGDGSNEHNNRYCRVSFQCQNEGVCHGIGGYFETVLYANKDGHTVELSTNPVTMDMKSKDMISWFPIYFPIKTPLYVPAGSMLVISMWRNTDDRKVWYEWILEVFDGNRPFKKVATSELHSSRKNGCLM